MFNDVFCNAYSVVQYSNVSFSILITLDGTEGAVFFCYPLLFLFEEVPLPLGA